MDLPTHIFVFSEAGDFQNALEFVFKLKLDVHEGTVCGSPSLEVFSTLGYTLLLQFSKTNGLRVKLYVGVPV